MISIRRTVFIRDIDQEVCFCQQTHVFAADGNRGPQVSEELIRDLFSQCGAVVDSRMCGDPNSALRFAFIEFDGEEAVTKARPASCRGLDAPR